MRTQREIETAIETFSDDPPDSDFQRGYLSALRWASGRDRSDPMEPGEISSMLARRSRGDMN